MITFDKIVNKLLKLDKKVLSISDIWLIIDPDFDKWNKKYLNEIYKIIYRLKSNSIIFPLKNWLYYLSKHIDIREIDIINNNYWDIVLKIIRDETNSNYIIAGNKSIEIHLKDYSIQSSLIVYTKDIQKNISINSQYKIQFKILSPGSKINKNHNFNFLKKYSSKVKISNLDFNIASEELSILDSLLIKNSKAWIDNYLINKFLIKYSKYLSREKLWELVKYRYISSINRLRQITKLSGDIKLYNICLDIIKLEWANCFLTIK